MVNRIVLKSIVSVSSLLSLLACWLIVSLGFAQESPTQPQPPERELFVPFEHLDLLLNGASQRIYMTREEWQQLRQDAIQTPEEKIPLVMAVLSADYKGVLSEGRALMRGDIELEVFNDDYQAIPLQINHVGLQSAMLDDKPAKLARSGDGQTLLIVQGKGRHQLTLQMVMPVSANAAQQTLTFHVPTAPTSRLHLTVPGNIEVKSGASTVSRTFDESQNLTQFTLLASREPMSIVMSLNNQTLRENSTLMSRGVLVAEVTAAYERLHATMSMSVLNGATDEFRFLVADDLEVNSVNCPLMSRWEVETNDVGKKVLVVKLRSAATESVVVTARLDRLKPHLDAWTLPEFKPINVAGFTSILGLIMEDRLKLTSLAAKSLFEIDADVLTAALPTSMFAAEPGAPRIQVNAAYYAASGEFGLGAEMELPKAELSVDTNSLFTISDAGCRVAVGISLTPENEKLFYFDFIISDQWKLQWIKGDNTTELKFDTYQVENGSRVRVLLPSGVAPGQAKTVWFEANSVPTDWLSDWSTQTIELPSFLILDARQQQGVVAVQLQDDLEVLPKLTEQLVVVSESEKAKHQLANYPTALAYRYFAPNWRAQIELSRAEPRVTARVLSFLRVETESLAIHDELLFLIDQARSKRLRFSLPESTPSEVTINALDGVRIKETTSELIDGRRHWTVDLAERHSGRVRLTVDFPQRLESQEVKGLGLPIVRAENVDYQTGAVAIEGHPEIEIQITKSPRSVDIGEMVDGEYQVGKRLLGVYGYVGTTDEIVLDLSHRPVHSLPATIVERAELVAVLSTQGVNQTAARYWLRTKANYFEVRLPTSAELWSVLLDGKPALPQRVGDQLLIAIPANSNPGVVPANTAPTGNPVLHDLQLVYESPVDAIQFRGDVELNGPSLFERASRNAVGVEIPIADLKWQVFVPNGFRVVAADGNQADLSIHPFEQFRAGIRQSVRLASQRMTRASTKASASESSTLKNPALPTPQSGEAMQDQESDAAKAIQPVPQDDLFQSPPQIQTANPVSDSPMVPPASPAGPPMAQAPSNANLPNMLPANESTKQKKSGKLWAMEGVRSLAIRIDTQNSGRQVELKSLGSRNQTRLTMVNQRRYDWAAWLLATLVFLFGVRSKTWSSRFTYLFLMVLIAFFVPVAVGWMIELEGIQFWVVMAVLGLLIYYCLSSIFCFIKHRRTAQRPSFVKVGRKQATATLLLLLSITTSKEAPAQNVGEENLNAESNVAEASSIGGTIITSPEQLLKLIDAFGQTPSAAIPDNAILVPYDPKSSEAGEAANPAQKILIPYAAYQQLWKLAHPEKQSTEAKPPTQFAWSDAVYRTTIEGKDSLRIVGTLRLEQFVDDALSLPLIFAGCVLEKATLDGQPAKLALITADQANSGLLTLQSSGKGTKELELVLLCKLERSGGWRITDLQIPSAPACQLSLTVGQPNTEMRLSGLLDRVSYLTTAANEKIETALPADGKLSLQWRDKISEANIDQGLTVQSQAVFDVREDALNFAWKGDLKFRRGRRETLTFMLPASYLVEKVSGNNIRGWTTKATEAGQQLDVELLKPAVDAESVVIIISKRFSIGFDESQPITAPQIRVPDAMLHQGHFTVRRSKLVELRAGEASGLSRIDLPDESSWLGSVEQPPPMPLTSYQSYSFSQPDAAVSLTATLVPLQLDAEIQSLLKISELETNVETRILIQPKHRPVYHVKIKLPADLRLDKPIAPAPFQWSIQNQDDGRYLNVFMVTGQSSTFPIVLKGELRADGVAAGSARPESATLTIPKFEVVDAATQKGAVVVQADPAYSVRATNLIGCEITSRLAWQSWVIAAQRPLVRTTVVFPTNDFSGQLAITTRTPEVTSTIVSNVKITDRAVEETIYLEAAINSAGIKEYIFQIPASMAKARIQAPLLRRKSIEPINQEAGAPLRVRLELQDAIIGQFAVMVVHDRLLTSEVQIAPLATVETGKISTRVITLENESRDEVVTDQIVSIEQLDRNELQNLHRLNLLGGKSSTVFRVREDQVANSAPRLTYSTKSRETVVTSRARIGLAQTLLVVDEFGGYRAVQEYRVENRMEPFLDLTLPAGARLWTVLVDNEPVKPSTSATSTTSVRVPLIKTAEGELDFPVTLKYGGQLDAPSFLSQTVFPFIKTENINVELSQVRLRLPSNYRWYNFGGSLGMVESQSDLQAGWLSFRTKQIGELTDLIGGRSKIYSKVRAQNNLKQLGAALEQQNDAFLNANPEQTVELKKQLDANYYALQQAQQQIEQFEVQTNDVQVTGNRDLLGGLYEAQQNGRAFNVLPEVGDNFTNTLGQASAKPGEGAGRFDNAWLSKNSLANPESASGLGRLSKGAPVQGPAEVTINQPNAPVADPANQSGQQPANLGQQFLPPGAKADRKSIDDAQQQIQGNYRQQAERYNQRLQQQNTYAERFGKMPIPQQSASLQSKVEGVATPGGAIGDRRGENDLPSISLGGVAAEVGSVPSNGSGEASRPGYLASLDVQLPVRGDEFFFTTTGGDLKLTAQNISRSTLDRIIRAVVILLVAAFILVLYRWAIRDSKLAIRG